MSGSAPGSTAGSDPVETQTVLDPIPCKRYDKNGSDPKLSGYYWIRSRGNGVLSYVYTALVQFSSATFLLRIKCVYTVPDQNCSSSLSRLHCTRSIRFLAKSMRIAGITLHARKEVRSETPPKHM